MIPLLLLGGCYQLDGFFFNPTAVDAYTLGGDVIPATCQESVSFDGEEGALYGAWAHQPRGAATECEAGERDTAAPVVIFFHGNGENIDGYWDHVELYWSSGYEVFIFDYRGYGRSWGTPTHDGVIADGGLAIAHVTDTTDLPSTSLTYIGLSLGGFVVVHNLTDTPPGVLITEDMFANSQKMMDDATDLDLPTGWFFNEDFDNLPAVHQMPEEIPYLVLHGDSDTYIQPEHAELVYEAAGATTKELAFIQGADHNDSVSEHPEELRTWIDCWIAQTCLPE